jgi:hypothetical protein
MQVLTFIPFGRTELLKIKTLSLIEDKPISATGAKVADNEKPFRLSNAPHPVGRMFAKRKSRSDPKIT